MNLSVATALLALSMPALGSSFSASARGTTGAEFLNLGAGARAASMGQASAAVADDASAIYWNPAAMTRVAHRSATLMHAAYVNASFFDYAGYVQNEGKLGAFGMAIQYFSAGKINQTDDTGASVGSFNPYDMALYWSYAREVAGISVGVTAKLVDSNILNTASAGAADIGLLSPRYLDGRLQLAFTAVNLGGDTLVYDQEGAQLPLTLRLGAALTPFRDLRFALDAVMPKSDNPYVATGMEYWLKNDGDWRFAGRAGFNSQTVGSIDGFTGVSLGFGVASRVASFDYAFVPLGGLGQAHRISLTSYF